MQIKNVKVKWASVQTPNTKFTPRYEICLYPDESGIKQLEDAGITMKVDKETGEKFYRATKNVTRKDGTENHPPRVVDMKKDQFTQLIGNGSVCNVILSMAEITSFGSPMIKGYLDAVQVVKHVPYVGREDFDEVDGDDLDGDF